jgi:hypothetical protein
MYMIVKLLVAVIQKGSLSSVEYFSPAALGCRAPSGATADDADFITYSSPDSKFRSFATTVSPFVQTPLLASIERLDFGVDDSYQEVISPYDNYSWHEVPEQMILRQFWGHFRGVPLAGAEQRARSSFVVIERAASFASGHSGERSGPSPFS